jgi:hypothetical protein
MMFIVLCKKIILEATKLHGISLSSTNPWVQDTPFGVYAEALMNLFDVTCGSPSEEIRIVALREAGVSHFFDIMEEWILEQDGDSALPMDDMTRDAIAFMVNHGNAESIIREWGFVQSKEWKEMV